MWVPLQFRGRSEAIREARSEVSGFWASKESESVVIWTPWEDERPDFGLGQHVYPLISRKTEFGRQSQKISPVRQIDNAMVFSMVFNHISVVSV